MPTVVNIRTNKARYPSLRSLPIEIALNKWQLSCEHTVTNVFTRDVEDWEVDMGRLLTTFEQMNTLSADEYRRWKFRHG